MKLAVKEKIEVNPEKVIRFYGVNAKGEEIYLGRHENFNKIIIAEEVKEKEDN